MIKYGFSPVAQVALVRWPNNQLHPMLNRNQDQLCTAMAPQCAKLSVAKIPVDVRIPQHSGHVYFLCPIGSHWFSLICIGSLCWANRCLSAWARSLNPTQTE
jgi:hypothetical protein